RMLFIKQLTSDASRLRTLGNVLSTRDFWLKTAPWFGLAAASGYADYRYYSQQLLKAVNEQLQAQEAGAIKDLDEQGGSKPGGQNDKGAAVPGTEYDGNLKGNGSEPADRQGSG